MPLRMSGVYHSAGFTYPEEKRQPPVNPDYVARECKYGIGLAQAALKAFVHTFLEAQLYRAEELRLNTTKYQKTFFIILHILAYIRTRKLLCDISFVVS